MVHTDNKLTHIDPLLGADRAGSRVQLFYQSLFDFVKQSSTKGGVVVQVAPIPPVVIPTIRRLVF